MKNKICFCQPVATFTLKINEKDNMKIAVPTVGDQIDQHFGHCEKYSVFTIEDKAIVAEEYMDSPAGCGCKSNMASKLAESGVKILIAGGIGNGAVNVLDNNGIKTIKGASGAVRSAVELFIRGELEDRGDICQSHTHDPNHVCQH
jgi:predicted Fe-Mo cluster-binding NifX family protein